MTTPSVLQSPDVNSQILVEFGKINVTLAHMEEKLAAIPDHENRIRELEGKIPVKLHERVTSLEKWRYALPTSIFMAFVSIVLTALQIAHVIGF